MSATYAPRAATSGLSQGDQQALRLAQSFVASIRDGRPVGQGEAGAGMVVEKLGTAGLFGYFMAFQNIVMRYRYTPLNGQYLMDVRRRCADDPGFDQNFKAGEAQTRLAVEACRRDREPGLLQAWYEKIKADLGEPGVYGFWAIVEAIVAGTPAW